MARVIKFFVFIEKIGDLLFPKKPPHEKEFSFENVQFSFWGTWVDEEELPECMDFDEDRKTLFGTDDDVSFGIFSREELDRYYPGLLDCVGAGGDIRGTSVKVAPNGNLYFDAFHKRSGDEVYASAELSAILVGKVNKIEPPDPYSHQFNPFFCAKCGGICQYNSEGELVEPLDSDELRCLDCGNVWIPADWTDVACTACGSKNYEG